VLALRRGRQHSSQSRLPGGVFVASSRSADAVRGTLVASCRPRPALAKPRTSAPHSAPGRTLALEGSRLKKAGAVSASRSARSPLKGRKEAGRRPHVRLNRHREGDRQARRGASASCWAARLPRWHSPSCRPPFETGATIPGAEGAASSRSCHRFALELALARRQSGSVPAEGMDALEAAA
jgi:hypothetical protein